MSHCPGFPKFLPKKEKKKNISRIQTSTFLPSKNPIPSISFKTANKKCTKTAALPSRRLPTLSDAVPFPSTLAPCPSAPPMGPGWGWFMPQGLMHPIGWKMFFGRSHSCEGGFWLLDFTEFQKKTKDLRKNLSCVPFFKIMSREHLGICWYMT